MWISSQNEGGVKVTAFERERLGRYVEDAGRWLEVIDDMLRYPESPSQAAASALARAARDIVAGIKQQLGLEGEQS